MSIWYIGSIHVTKNFFSKEPNPFKGIFILTVIQNECWPKGRKLKKLHQALHVEYGKVMIFYIFGSVIFVTVISATFSSIFHVIYMDKLKFDKQRAKRVYPVLEMLNNQVKGLTC